MSQKKIESISDLNGWISGITEKHHPPTEEVKFVFRGLTDDKYDLIPSISRKYNRSDDIEPVND